MQQDTKAGTHVVLNTSFIVNQNPYKQTILLLSWKRLVRYSKCFVNHVLGSGKFTVIRVFTLYLSILFYPLGVEAVTVFNLTVLNN